MREANKLRLTVWIMCMLIGVVNVVIDGDKNGDPDWRTVRVPVTEFVDFDTAPVAGAAKDQSVFRWMVSSAVTTQC